MTDTTPQPTMKNLLYWKKHPKKSPLLGWIINHTLCILGHELVIMELENWDEAWVACARCGARFIPKRALRTEEL